MRYYKRKELEFLKKHVEGTSWKELTAMFNEKFGLNKSVSAIKQFGVKHGLKNGVNSRFQNGHTPWCKGMKGIDCAGENGKRTQFKKGQKSLNSCSVGTEKLDASGYTRIKVAEPSVWRQKHRMIWEKANGPIPEGYTVIFGDGNKRNFDLDNLILVSRSQLQVMNNKKLIKNDAELTRVGMVLAEISSKVHEKRKQLKS